MSKVHVRCPCDAVSPVITRYACCELLAVATMQARGPRGPPTALLPSPQSRLPRHRFVPSPMNGRRQGWRAARSSSFPDRNPTINLIILLLLLLLHITAACDSTY